MRERYQDRWVRGRVVEPGVRECGSRWRAIRNVLAEYSRPFTMLEIGADVGYFSLRAAEEFDCVAVAIDGGPQLAESLERNNLPGTVALQRRLSIDDVLAIGSCEHFDVVLALNVLHHFGAPGPALSAVLRLGDRTIIETPPPDDQGACGQSVIPALFEMIRRRDPVEIARTPSHTTGALKRPMYLLETPKQELTRAYIGVPNIAPLGPMSISSTLSRKTVEFFRKDEVRDWLPGINLQTYLRLGGVYPNREAIERMVREMPLPEKHHGDIRPWNFILDGRGVRLIDGGDDRAIYEDAAGRELTATMVAQGGAG